jgi:hypothetical protein
VRIVPRRLLLILAALLPAGLALAQPFTIVMLPDTQNYVDFTRQKSAGFALDSSELYLRQMEHIASKGLANGGDVVFVAAVGDVWQHVLRTTDPEHERRGIRSVGADLGFSALIEPDETLNFEIPTAAEGYRLLSDAGIPFGVPPGNHDYDAWWTAPVAGTVPADAGADALASVPPENQEIHFGGLEAFKQVFGGDSEFFRDKNWYVDAFDGGTSSAQVFAAGRYRFLHLALEMHAGDQVLAWAQRVLDDHPRLPTIVSTHDYLSPRGERRPLNNMDLALADPGYNNDAETIWRKFISRNDQIFMVLSGHQAGQWLRVDRNEAGHAVYQILADYQDRGQAAVDAGQPPGRNGQPAPVGDGWYREMRFHLAGRSPRVEVRTYSTHYRAYSSELPTYAQWYRPHEQPSMSDEEFLRADEFTLELADFRERFGSGSRRRSARPDSPASGSGGN